MLKSHDCVCSYLGELTFPVKMKSFCTFQIAHYVAFVQGLISFGILIDGFDGDKIYLRNSNKPLPGTLQEITSKGEENQVAVAARL